MVQERSSESKRTRGEREDGEGEEPRDNVSRRLVGQEANAKPRGGLLLGAKRRMALRRQRPAVEELLYRES